MEGDIPKAVAKMLEQYDKIRGKDVKEEGVQFWDLVVITSRDEAQKEAYNTQIQNKLLWGELPRGVVYKVFSDPPGPKIGCGGCTMYVLDLLEQEYGDKLFDWRILLINAGGYSQRLPSTSVMGKVFMALPIGEHQMYQILDFKLACYLPFLQRMSPGVFHAASDTIEVYDIGPSPSFTFDKGGFTAIAHPNSLAVGKSHGVFVLNDEYGSDTVVTEMAQAKEVLQKPSEQMMREKGAVKVNKKGEEIVFTDSFYFYDHSITRKFIEFHKSEGPFDCELDSYGDFFQPLGPNASEDYVYNTSKVVNVSESLIPTRKKIFKMLKSTSLNVIILNSSKFYHLGTTKENLHHFCDNEVMAKEVGFTRDVFTVYPSEHHEGQPRKIETHHEGVQLHSIIPHSTVISKCAIVEFCQFGVPLNVGENCILSNCTLSDDGLEAKEVLIPASTFLHSVALGENGSTLGYCTVLFKIDDDIKQRGQKTSEVEGFTYLGKQLKSFMKVLGIPSVSDLVSNENFSLWDVKLFPVANSMSESFLWALEIAQAVRNETPIDNSRLKNARKVSMDCIMKQKNVKVMLQYRNDLYSCIAALKCEQEVKVSM